MTACAAGPRRRDGDFALQSLLRRDLLQGATLAPKAGDRGRERCWRAKFGYVESMDAGAFTTAGRSAHSLTTRRRCRLTVRTTTRDKPPRDFRPIELMAAKRARILNDSVHHLTAVPTRTHNHSRVDCRSPAERAVEAVLAAVAPDAPARGRCATTRDDRDHLPGETALWIATIQDALDCADAIHRGAPLPATGTSAAAIGWTGNRKTRRHDPADHNDYDRAAERRTLRQWVAGDYLGSLRWIADHLALSDVVVGRIRASIEAAIRATTRRRVARAAA